jgi:hypothetical protein
MPTPRKMFATLLDYDLRDEIAETITCPALICEGANDLFGRRQAQVLFDHLTCPKAFLEFTEEKAPTSTAVRSAAPDSGPDLRLAGRHRVSPAGPRRGPAPREQAGRLCRSPGRWRVLRRR